MANNKVKYPNFRNNRSIENKAFNPAFNIKQDNYCAAMNLSFIGTKMHLVRDVKCHGLRTPKTPSNFIYRKINYLYKLIF